MCVCCRSCVGVYAFSFRELALPRQAVSEWLTKVFFGGINVCFVSGCVCSSTDLICEVIRQCVFLICLGTDRSDMQFELTEVDFKNCVFALCNSF